MAKTIELIPTAGASSNPLGISFGATAELEFNIEPERIVNKNLTGVSLTMVDLTGVYVSKGIIRAFIPWSNVLSFVY